jgi:hypothetical protein
MLFGLNDGSSMYIGVGTETGYKASAMLNSGGGLVEVTIGTNSNGTWAHYCATFGATMRAYLNGVQSSSTPPTQPTVVLTQLGTIWSAVALNFSGDIAEAAVWNIALSASDVATLAAGVRADTIQAANLKQYWRIAGTVSPEPDEMGGTGLTINGTCPKAATDPPWISSGGPKGRFFQMF